MNLVKGKVGTGVGMMLLLGVCFVALAAGSIGQRQHYDPPRPVLEFRCPTYSIPQVSSLELIGEVLGVKETLGDEWARQIVYEWQISQGKVISGQGTPRLVWASAQDHNVQELEVKLNIKGAPPDIPGSKSCFLRFDPSCIEHRVGGYKSDNTQEEQSALDAAASLLKTRDSISVLYILSYAGRSSCISEANWRANRAKKYLAEKHGINEHRVIPVDGGYQETFSVELIITPGPTCGPLPKPTLTWSQIKVHGLCADKFKE